MGERSLQRQVVLSDEHQLRTPDEVLSELSERVKALHQEGIRFPVIVYDLDATLFDNRPRVLKILENTLAQPEAEKLPAEVVAAVRRIQREGLQYRLTDTLQAHGVTDPDLLTWFQGEWHKRFFTNEYVVYDEPMAGAVEFVNRLHGLGSCSVYLTGRDTPGMRTGTLTSLSKWGFPEPDGGTCHLITKPTFEQPDPEFKQDAIEQIRGLGTVAGVFDNEPKPLNVVARAFPEALIYFLDTMHSPDIEPVEAGIRVLPDFQLNR